MSTHPVRHSGASARGLRYVTHDMALKWRLMLMLALLILLCVAAVGFISVHIYSDNIIAQTTERKHELGASALEAIGIIRMRDEYSARLVERNDNIMVALSYNGIQQPYTHFEEVWNCSKALMEMADKSNIVGLAALGYKGKSFFSKSETSATNVDALTKLTGSERVQRSTGECIWIPSKLDIFGAGAGAGQHTLYVVNKVYYTRNAGQAVGLSVAQVQYGRFCDILNRMTTGKGGYAAIADGDGMILFTTGDQGGVGARLPEDIFINIMGLDSTGSFRLDGEGGPVLCLFNRDSRSGWVMIQAVPYAEIAGAADDVRRWIILVIAACLIVALAAAWLFARTFASPVVRLEKVMAQFGGGRLDARSPADRGDEIGALQKSFNGMAEQINALLQDREEEHRRKRMMEIRMLEYQINPHFLYNSLDSINWMANTAGNREIAEMAAALARFFRLGLSRGRETVSVADEAEHARNYLVISKIRYHDGFRFDVTVDPEIAECKIVKLVIQPLAENALVHGIKKTGSGGVVQVRAFGSGERVVIEIEDNGKGIPPERVNMIREALAQNPKDGGYDGGIGLMNVQRRIRLYYGAEYGLEMESEEGKGAVARIVLPRINA